MLNYFPLCLSLGILIVLFPLWVEGDGVSGNHSVRYVRVVVQFWVVGRDDSRYLGYVMELCCWRIRTLVAGKIVTKNIRKGAEKLFAILGISSPIKI